MTDDLSEWFIDDPRADQARSMGRGTFVDVVLEAISTCKTRASSTVLSLVGAWGSGKSSIIDAVSESVTTTDAGWKVVTFNPWTYQDLASLQSGFFGELSNVFPDESKTAGARKLVADFADTVAPLSSILAVVGVNPSEAVKGVGRLIRGDQSASAAHRTLEKTLTKQATPILVIMDDLDRLAPDELLLTFKLVRLIGRLPFVHYLLAYDEDTLLDAVSRTGLVGKSKSRARDYLEKVVQVRLDVPALRPTDVRELTERLLNRTLAEVGTDLDRRQESRFSHAYAAHLEHRLTTPRSIHRYFSQVRLGLRELPNELDVSDFLLLTWLRTAEPGAYRLVQDRRSLMLGSLRANSTESQLPADELSKSLVRALSDSGTRLDDLEGVAGILGSVFPAFRSAWIGKPLGTRSHGAKRASNPHYFDRYFALGVPDDDIADATVAAAVADIVACAPLNPAESKLIATLIKSPDLAIAKIDSAADTVDPAPIVAWLARHYFDIPDSNNSWLHPRSRATVLGQRLLRTMSTKDVLELAPSMTRTESGLAFAVEAIAAATRTFDEDPPGTRHLKLSKTDRKTLGELVKHTYEDLQLDRPFDIPPPLWSAVWPWSEIHAPSLARWIEGRRAKWGTLDLMARFVGMSTLVGTGLTGLTDVDFGILENVTDLPAIERELEADVRKVVVPTGYQERLPNTPKNRRSVALQKLRVRQQERDATTAAAD